MLDAFCDDEGNFRVVFHVSLRGSFLHEQCFSWFCVGVLQHSCLDMGTHILGNETVGYLPELLSKLNNEDLKIKNIMFQAANKGD